MSLFEKHGRGIFYASVFLLLIIACFSHGLAYFPYADDYNQFGVYYRRTLEGGVWDNVIMFYRRFSDRPLSFFADAYIFAPFFNRMAVVLFFLVTLHFLNVVIIKDIFARSGIIFSPVAVVVFTLYPMLYESVYWISASSRIVLATFFSVLSIWCFLWLLSEKNVVRRNVVMCLYIVLNILSVGFYEQIIVYMLVFHVIIVCLNMSKIKGLSLKSACFAPLMSVIAIGAYYVSTGAIGGRRGTAVSSGFWEHSVSTAHSIAALFTVKNASFAAGGLRAAFGSNMLPVLALLLSSVILLLALWRVKTPGESSQNRTFAAIIASLLLIVCPYGIFFILRDADIAPRSMYASFTGVALLVGALLDLVFRRKKRTLALTAAVIALISAISLSGIVYGYKVGYARNEAAMESFLHTFSEAGYNNNDGNRKICVLNALPKFDDMPADILPVTAEAWRLQGMLNAVVGGPRFTAISVVAPGTPMTDDAEMFFYMDYSGNLSDVSVIPVFLDGNTLRDGSGSIVGYVENGLFVSANRCPL